MNARSGQSIFDMAIRLTGDAEAAIELALDNDLSLTDPLSVTVDFVADPINRKVVEYHRHRPIRTATACEVAETPYRIFDITFDLSFE